MGNRHPKVKSEKYRTASSPKNSSPDDEEDDIRPRDANKSSRKNKGRSPDDEEASGGSENRDEARDLSPTSPASNVTSGEKTDTPTSGGGTTQARTTEGADSSTSEARRDSKEMKRVSASRGIISRGLEFVGSKEPKSSDFIFDNSGRMVSDYYDVDKRVLGHGTYGRPEVFLSKWVKEVFVKMIWVPLFGIWMACFVGGKKGGGWDQRCCGRGEACAVLVRAGKHVDVLPRIELQRRPPVVFQFCRCGDAANTTIVPSRHFKL